MDLGLQATDTGRPKASAPSHVLGLSGVPPPSLNHIVRLSTALRRMTPEITHQQPGTKVRPLQGVVNSSPHSAADISLLPV